MTLSASRPAALCLAFAASTMFLGAASAEPIQIRISTPAVESDWHAQMLPVFAETLEQEAPGEFDVEIHLAGTLFAQGTEPVAMQRGNLEMALISAQDISRQIPAWSIFTAGYLIRDPEHQAAVFGGDIGEEFFGMVAEEMNLHILDVAYLGTRQLNLRGDAEINTPDDLAGVNLRMPDADTWQFLGEALGASPLPMAFGEVYTALQTGAIDAQDNPLPTVRAANFYEVTDQIVLTGHLVDGVFITIAGSVWDDLTDDQKQAMETAAAAAVAFNNENRIAQEAELLAFFEEQGLTVHEPDIDAFRERVQEAYLSSPFSADWPEGMVERINAVE